MAPFDDDEPVELGALDSATALVATWKPDWKLTGILPADPPRHAEYRADTAGLARGSYRLAPRVPNPMLGSRPLGFANRIQDRALPGWHTLGEFMR